MAKRKLIQQMVYFLLLFFISTARIFIFNKKYTVFVLFSFNFYDMYSIYRGQRYGKIHTFAWICDGIHLYIHIRYTCTSQP